MRSSEGDNGVLRCYNMFPTQFASIDAMTEYLPQIHRMGFNAVWLNPIQLSGNVSQEKSDKITGVASTVSHSIYAMSDTEQFDGRFSVIKPDEKGNYVFTEEQKKIIHGLSESEKDKLGIPTDRAELEELLNAKVDDIIAANQAKRIQAEESIKSIRESLKSTTDQEQKNKLQDELRTKDHYLKKGGADKEKFEAISGLHKKQQKIVQYFDKEAIRRFTTTAKELGLSPMFDLVLNHVSADSPLVTQEGHEKWFDDDASFSDVKKFKYDTENTPQIIDEVWKPFITKYINDYGFSGVRVDCARKIPSEIRKGLYTYITGLTSPTKPIILEEALFSNISPREYAESSGKADATHITGGSYYQERQWHGGLDRCIGDEDGFKSTTVSIGTINFTGNHDHTSAAMTVLVNMAQARLYADTRLKAATEKALTQLGKTGFYEASKQKLLYPIIQDIQREMREYPDGETKKKFTRDLKDKLFTNMVTGSAGYYLLSGDEVANPITPSVFLREGRREIVPQRELRVFSNRSLDEKVKYVLKELATSLLERHKLGDEKEIWEIYSSLGKEDKELKDRLLRPYIDQIKDEINAGVPETYNNFVNKMLKAGVSVTPEYDTRPKGTSEAWKDSPHDMTGFIKDVNNILAGLPKVEKGFWSESFLLDENTAVLVRKNGESYKSPTDIVICNLSSEARQETIGLKDLTKIAVWMQRRGFATSDSQDVYAANHHNPTFNECFESMMGEDESVKTRIHATSGIIIAGEIDFKDGGIKEGFLASKPKSGPLFRKSSTIGIESIHRDPTHNLERGNSHGSSGAGSSVERLGQQRSPVRRLLLASRREQSLTDVTQGESSSGSIPGFPEIVRTAASLLPRFSTESSASTSTEEPTTHVQSLASILGSGRSESLKGLK